MWFAGCIGTKTIWGVAGAESAGVKWPNDVLVDQKKVAGILTDCSIMGTSVLALVGVGVR